MDGATRIAGGDQRIEELPDPAAEGTQRARREVVPLAPGLELEQPHRAVLPGRGCPALPEFFGIHRQGLGRRALRQPAAARGGPAAPDAPGLGVGRLEERFRFFDEDVGSLEIVGERALEAGGSRKPECGMWLEPVAIAHPLPGWRREHGDPCFQLADAALRLDLELPKRLDAVETELDPQRQRPVHREHIHDAAASGEVPGSAHRVLVAVTRAGQRFSERRGRPARSHPQGDGRLADAVGRRGARQRSARRGDDERRRTVRGDEGMERDRAERQRLRMGRHSGVRVDSGTGEADHPVRGVERREQ